jgi:hypothetical protein
LAALLFRALNGIPGQNAPHPDLPIAAIAG